MLQSKIFTLLIFTLSLQHIASAHFYIFCPSVRSDLLYLLVQECTLNMYKQKFILFAFFAKPVTTYLKSPNVLKDRISKSFGFIPN